MRGKVLIYSFLLITVVGWLPSLHNAVAASNPKVKLIVNVIEESGQVFKWTLNCQPNSGNHPSLGSACRFLTTIEGKRALTIKPSSTNCLQVFGGEATARITGLFYGKKVSVTLNRKDGCGITQWDSLIKLVRYR